MSSTKPSVLIVEDEFAIAQLLILNLKHGGFEPVLATDAKSAQAHVSERLPDVVLLDWMLPDGSGPELAKQWRRHERTQMIPIIMITAKGEEANKIEGLESGADDYITKPFSPQELIARIRALLRRRLPEKGDAAVSFRDLTIDVQAHLVSYKGQPLKIGPTEFKLLLYFMNHPNRVHTRTHLLNRVWGNAADLEDRTVDVHIKRLRENLHDAGHFLQTVRGVGYKFTAYSET